MPITELPCMLGNKPMKLTPMKIHLEGHQMLKKLIQKDKRPGMHDVFDTLYGADGRSYGKTVFRRYCPYPDCEMGNKLMKQAAALRTHLERYHANIVNMAEKVNQN